MTGWRLGYVIAPKEFIRPMQKLSRISLSPQAPLPNGVACRAERGRRSGGEDDPPPMTSAVVFSSRSLRNWGSGLRSTPTAPSTFWPMQNAFRGDSYRLAFAILKEAKVGVTPGHRFRFKRRRYLRFSYANSLENIEEGMNRLQRYLEKYR